MSTFHNFIAIEHLEFRAIWDVLQHILTSLRCVFFFRNNLTLYIFVELVRVIYLNVVKKSIKKIIACWERNNKSKVCLKKMACLEE